MPGTILVNKAQDKTDCVLVNLISVGLIKGPTGESKSLKTVKQNQLELRENQRKKSPILSPYFSYKRTETILRYQENSPWVIISLILMTSGVK